MIRPYEARDFSDVKFLNDISYLKPCTESELREKLSAGKCWVYGPRFEVSAVVGAVIVCPQDGKDFVWSLTVSPAWQRKGIGGQLMAEAEKHFPELWLHTEHESAGFNLYKKRGYKYQRTESGFYGGQDAVLMVKRKSLMEETVCAKCGATFWAFNQNLCPPCWEEKLNVDLAYQIGQG